LEDLASVEAKLKIVDELEALEIEIASLNRDLAKLNTDLLRNQKAIDDLTQDNDNSRRAIAELRAKIECIGPINTPANIADQLKRYNELINSLLKTSNFKRKATPDESEKFHQASIQGITFEVEDEFLLITNRSDKTVDLAGWHIEDRVDGSVFEFRLSTEIPPHQSVHVWHAQSKFKDTKFDYVWATRSNPWSKSKFDFVLYYWARHYRNYHESKAYIGGASVNRPSAVVTGSNIFIETESSSHTTTTQTSFSSQSSSSSGSSGSSIGSSTQSSSSLLPRG